MIRIAIQYGAVPEAPTGLMLEAVAWRLRDGTLDGKLLTANGEECVGYGDTRPGARERLIAVLDHQFGPQGYVIEQDNIDIE